MQCVPRILLTGKPGSGKTTVLARVAEILAGHDHELGGFYTEEIRESGRRSGFRLVSFDGAERVMSHVDFPKERRVSRYGVDVEAIDEFVRRTLEGDRLPDVWLVDEIGKMECLSDRFVRGVRRLLEGDVPALITVALRGGGFIAEVKRREDVELLEVTRANREELPPRVVDRLL